MSRYQFQSGDDVYLDRMRDILTSNPGQPPSEPSKLLPHIYLGSQFQAESLRLLRKLGITHVLNCAGFKGPRKNPDQNPYEEFNIDYYEFKADDHDFYDITQHFGEAFRYLDNAHAQGGRVLVHCALGVNRSAAVCAAYLMVQKQTPLLQVITFLKSKRRLLLSNKGFQRQLVRFARSRRLLDVLPLVVNEEKAPLIKPWSDRNGMSVRLENPRSRLSHSDLGEERPTRRRVPEIRMDIDHSRPRSKSRDGRSRDRLGGAGASGAYSMYRRFIFRGEEDM